MYMRSNQMLTRHVGSDGRTLWENPIWPRGQQWALCVHEKNLGEATGSVL
jgi:hypothetical protein